jgi:hypothetical protein
MDGKQPRLPWTPASEGYIFIKHRVRRETLDALMDAEDLSLVSSRFGRLMLQGTVNGKCYRLVVEVVEVVDKAAGILEPVTGYRYAAGDPKKGGTA